VRRKFFQTNGAEVTVLQVETPAAASKTQWLFESMHSFEKPIVQVRTQHGVCVGSCELGMYSILENHFRLSSHLVLLLMRVQQMQVRDETLLGSLEQTLGEVFESQTPEVPIVAVVGQVERDVFHAMFVEHLSDAVIRFDKAVGLPNAEIEQV